MRPADDPENSAEPEQRRVDSKEGGTEPALWTPISLPDVRAETRDLKSSPVDDPVLPGTRVDRYSILQELGRGGMGTVFKAVDDEGNLFAIKVMRQERSQSKNADVRMEKEIRGLVSVQHPNVLKLIDVPNLRGQQFLVTEFIDGPDLHDYVKSTGPMSVTDASDLFLGILDGLDAIHQQGMVHRDLKPGNVLLRSQAVGSEIESLTGVIADFGLSRFLEQSESMQITRVDATIGTPPFMPPEQFGSGRPSDVRSDIFSLAATFYYAITGHAPLEAETVNEYRKLYWDQQFNWDNALSKLPTPESLRSIFRKALSISPEERFQSASWMRDELQRSVEGRPTRLLKLSPLPDTNEDVQEVDFRWRLKSKPEHVWKYLADTNQVNQFLKLPLPKFSHLNKRPVADAATSDSNQHLRASNWLMQADATTVFGRLRWREYPFEWTVNQFHQVLRKFDSGPFRWIQSRVELKQIEGRSDETSLGIGANPLRRAVPAHEPEFELTHRFKFRCRNHFFRLLALAHLHWQVFPKLERLYKRIDSYVEMQVTERRTTLSPFAAKNRLPKLTSLSESFQQKLIDLQVVPTVASALLTYLANRSLAELANIRPLEFSRKFELTKQDAIKACLAAVKCGLLSMRWSAICPICRVEASSVNQLSEIKPHVDCDYCQTKQAVDFSKRIELIFEIHPAIGKAIREKYCVGGPFHLPHVFAQRIVPADSTIELRLELPIGLYQISGPQFPNVKEFCVTKKTTASHFLELFLDRLDSVDSKDQVVSGTQVLLLNNESDQDLLVRIQESNDLTERLSLQKILRIREFSAWFPEQIRSNSQLMIANLRLVLVVQVQAPASSFARQLETIREIVANIESNGGEILLLGNRVRILATFENLQNLDFVVSRLRGFSNARFAVMETMLETGIVGERLVHFIARQESTLGKLENRMSDGEILIDESLWQSIEGESGGFGLAKSMSLKESLVLNGIKVNVLSPT